MLALFSIPKPLSGHIGIIQRNAFASWRRLGPDVSVVLMGSDAGVGDAAQEFGFDHLPHLNANVFGTPSITDAFTQVRRRSTRPFVMYANADMLFDRSLIDAVRQASQLPHFLLSGQRWDHDITNDLTAASNSAWHSLFAQHRAHGRLRGASAMDYFVFPRNLDFEMPEFAVGRVGWDSWLVWQCRRRKIPVIDATSDVVAIHQNHSYASLVRGCQHREGPERTMNIKQAGGLANLFTLREANFVLKSGALQRPTGARWFTARLADYRPYHCLLATKRWAQQLVR